ncbi:MAG: T9SS type A sorting domain-containing protein [Bacteroidota bacterium]|nr:T9SS type A sorting domain-containing protein [Bacteroidota bacterium]
MKHFITILLLIVSVLVSAQSNRKYTRVWSTYFGGAGTSAVTGVVDSHGNAIVLFYIGAPIPNEEDYYNQFSTDENFPFNENRTFIAKFSSDGTLIYSKYTPFFVHDLLIDSNDYLYILGTTNNPDLATHHIWDFDFGTSSSIVARLNPDLLMDWCANVPSDVNSMCFDDDQNLYVAGTTLTNQGITTDGTFQPDFIAEPSTNGGYIKNGFVFKLNNQGQLQWSTYNGIDLFSPKISFCNNELVLFFGFNLTQNTYLFNQYGNYYHTADAYQQTPTNQIVSKFNPNNGQRVYSTYIGNDNFVITDLACYNGYFYTLSVTSGGLDSSLISPDAYQPNYGGDLYDLHLGKFEHNLSPIGGTYIGGNGIDYCHPNHKALILNNKTLRLAGGTFSNNLNFDGLTPYQNNNNNGEEVLIMEFATDGLSPTWGSYFGGSGEDVLPNLIYVDDQTFYVIGGTTSSQDIATAGSYQENLSIHPNFPNHTANGFVTKFVLNNELNVENHHFGNEFVLYPNPTTEVVTIQANQLSEINSVEVFNTLGQKVFEDKYNNVVRVELNFSQFSKGIYLIKVNDSFLQKVVLK